MKTKGGTPASVRFYSAALKWARVLSFVPYIRAIILTGSVYKKTASYESDIDIIVVSKDEHAWLTHAQLFVFLTLLGMRRTKKVRAGKICVNATIPETKFQNAYLQDGKVLWYGKSKSIFLEKICDTLYISRLCEEVAQQTINSHVEKKFVAHMNHGSAILNNTKNIVQYYPPRVQNVDSLEPKKARS